MQQAPNQAALARLLFVSRSTYPLGHVSDIEVFRTSIRRNRIDSISGVILRGETWFCQVLEGPGPILDRTFARIAVDPRHGAIRRWWQTYAPTQLFAGWETEHWGLSPQIERFFVDMIQSDHIASADKVILVRSFATMRRSAILSGALCIENGRDAALDLAQVGKPVHALQQTMRKIVAQQR